MLFNFNSPTDIYFGKGYFEKTSEITKNVGLNPLIVCGRNSMRKNKFIEKISKNFKKDKKNFLYMKIFHLTQNQTRLMKQFQLLKKIKMIL